MSLSGEVRRRREHGDQTKRVTIEGTAKALVARPRLHGNVGVTTPVDSWRRRADECGETIADTHGQWRAEAGGGGLT